MILIGKTIYSFDLELLQIIERGLVSLLFTVSTQRMCGSEGSRRSIDRKNPFQRSQTCHNGREGMRYGRIRFDMSNGERKDRGSG